MDFDKLAKHLKPLGLSQVRATHLKLIANGFLNKDRDSFRSDHYLRSFPGVGSYIANSVRCCVFDEPLPALDTNMIRVIERVFGWRSKRKRAREDKALWSFAETLVPKTRPKEYNWGVLDLGAAICTARNPKCLICPLNDICQYFQQVEKSASSLSVEESDSE
jgi:A/G-specific adenine glycosylase